MVEYLVKWEGYSDEENTWEAKRHLDCEDLIRDNTYSLIQSFFSDLHKRILPFSVWKCVATPRLHLFAKMLTIGRAE